MKLLFYFAQTDRKQIFLAVLSSIASGISSAALIGMISRQLNRTEPLNTNTIAIYVGLVLLAIVTNLFARWVLIRVASHRSYSLHMTLIQRILATPLTQIETTGTPKLSAALLEDANTIAFAFMQVPGFFVNTAIVTGCVLYLAWLSPIAFAMLTIITVPIFFVYRRLHRHAVSLLKDFFRLRDQIFKQCGILTSGIKELKINSQRRYNFTHEQAGPTAKDFRQKMIGMRMAHEIANSCSQSAYFVFVLVLLLLIATNRVEIQILGGYALIALFMRGSINQLLRVVPQWTHAAAALEKIETLGLAQPEPGELRQHTQEAYKQELSNQEPGIQQLEPLSETLCLQFSGIQHTYKHEANDNTFSIGPIDFTLNSGELVFITGSNGSGKTTLLKVLASLYQPESGQISLNDTIVTNENSEWYRQHFSVIFTDFHLFENIVGNENKALHQTANYYLKQLQLAEKVSIQNNQISTLNLSYGQRKRVALLHAYLEDRPIYIFDEWASGQDPSFKEIFYRELLPELVSRNKLVIVTSHDDQYFSVADRVINLDGINTALR